MTTSMKSYRKTTKKTYDSAAEKFDALFGSSAKPLPTQTKKSDIFSSPIPEPTKKTKQSTGIPIPPEKLSFIATTNGKSPKKKSPQKTKYEELFKKNEKNASDKFDMVFSEDLNSPTKKSTSKTTRITTKAKASSNLFDDDSASKLPKSNPVVKQAKSASEKFDEMLNEDLFTTSKKPTKLSPKKNKHSPTKNNKAISSPTFSRELRNGNSGTSILSSPKKENSETNISHATVKKVEGNLVVSIHKRNGANLLPFEPVEVKKSDGNKKTDLTQKTFDKNTQEFLKLTKSSPNAKSKQNLVSRKRQNEGINLVPLINIKRKCNLVPVDTYSTNSVTIYSTTKSAEDEKLKSKKLLSVTNKSKKISYNARPWMEDEVLSATDADEGGKATIAESSTDIALTRSATWPQQNQLISEKKVSSIKCNKNSKQVFTVVQHTKNYQNCLEEGEMIEFKGDFLYLKSGISPSQPLNVRCQSTVAFARKCLQQNFRLYTRAHGALPKFFDSLEDCPTLPMLANCTALVLLVLSRDRQIDITKKILHLLMQLVDPFNKMKATQNAVQEPSDTSNKKYRIFKSRNNATTNAEDEKVVQKEIKEVIKESNDGALDADCYDTKGLAGEALIRFTVHRKSDWFKEELRLKGGMDHFISLVTSNIDKVTSIKASSFGGVPEVDVITPCLHTMVKIVQALHSAIEKSHRSAMYLVTHQRALLLRKLSLLLGTCGDWMGEYKTNSIEDDECLEVIELLRKTIDKVLILLLEISNNNEWASTRIGEQKELLNNIIRSILLYSKFVDKDKESDMMIMGLGLLVNLLECSPNNRMLLKAMKTKPYSEENTDDEDDVLVIEAFVQLFLSMEEAAIENEILGEVGVKKKAQELQDRMITDTDGDITSSQSSMVSDGGRMVETEDGMVWVADTSDDVIKCSQDTIPLSQDIPMSSQSAMDLKKVEASLTAEQKTEMHDAINKANEHMEASMIAAYTALVLGCLISGNRHNAELVTTYLPNGDMTSMITMLKKFHGFMNITDGMSKQGEKSLVQVIELMEEINAENGFIIT